MIDRTFASWYGPRALPGFSPAVSKTRLAWPLLAALTASGVGCGPIEYINQVSIRAAGAVSAAKLAQADRYAPYEYTAAEEYLHKAREEASYAEYEDAIEFGHKAEELADKGRAIAVARLSQSAGGSPSGAAATPASESRAATPASESRASAPRSPSEDENPK
jgi:Domain of unknown function (DUF4398)